MQIKSEFSHNLPVEWLAMKLRDYDFKNKHKLESTTRVPYLSWYPGEQEIEQEVSPYQDNQNCELFGLITEGRRVLT